MDKQWIHVERNFGPLYDENSRVLILGSFPSVASRAAAFYYGHKQNRFWPLMSRLLQAPLPVTTEEKKELMLTHGIALYDSIFSCDICGSSDASIRNAVPVDAGEILRAAKIVRVFCNGAASGRVYQKYLYPLTGLEAVTLPSTSPANAAMNLDRLYEAWQPVLEALALPERV